MPHMMASYLITATTHGFLRHSWGITYEDSRPFFHVTRFHAVRVSEG